MAVRTVSHRSESELQPIHVAAWTVAIATHLMVLAWVVGVSPEGVRRPLTPPPVYARMLDPASPVPVVPPPPDPVPPTHHAVQTPHPVAPTPVHPVAHSEPVPTVQVPDAPVVPSGPSTAALGKPHLEPMVDTEPTALGYAGSTHIGYPMAALRAHQAGTVVLSVSVSAEGRATAVSVKRSSGVSALDQAALNAVRGWMFKPSTRDGVAQAGMADITVAFQLDR